MGYRDITSQSAVKPVLWGTRAVERDKKRQQELEQLHNVRVGKEVKIQVEDFKECGRMAEELGGDGKDCKTCKCNKVVGDIGLCTIPEVEKALGGEK